MPDSRGDPAVTISRLLRRQCLVSGNSLIIVAPRESSRPRWDPTVSKSAREYREQAPSPQPIACNVHESGRMARFQAINKLSSRTPDRDADMISLPSLSNDEDHAEGDAPVLAQLPDRDFPVDRVLDVRGEGPGQTLEYLVSWTPADVPAALVHRRENGTEFTRTQDKDYVVHRNETVPLTDGSGAAIRHVEWEPSWEPAPALSRTNHADAVAAFEKSRLGPSPQLGAPQPPVQRSMDSAPAITRPSARDRFAHVPKAHLRALVFKPQVGLDHGPAVKELARKMLNRKAMTWLEDLPRRPLLFRSKWTELCRKSDKQFDLLNTDRLRPTLAHMAGSERSRPCRRCTQRLGPFQRCVVAPGLGNGACTNCVCAGSGKSCDFHHSRKSTTYPSCPVGPELTESAATDVPPRAPRPKRKRGASTPTVVGAYESLHGGTSSESAASARPSSGGGVDNRVQMPLQPGHANIAPTLQPPSLAQNRSTAMMRRTSNEELAPPAERAAQPRSRGRDLLFAYSSGALQNTTPAGPATEPGTAPTADSPASRPPASEEKTAGDGQAALPSVSPPPSTEPRKRPVLNSMFRHEGCGRGRTPCVDPVAGCVVVADESDPALTPGFVTGDRSFTEFDASGEEVRYIISRCGCPMADFLERAWRHWLDYEAKIDEEPRHTKESFLSMVYYESLTDAVATYIRERPPPVYIDLVENSDKEDDEPPRSAKRVRKPKPARRERGERSVAGESVTPSS